MAIVSRDRVGDRGRSGVIDVIMPDLRDRRGIAPADARRSHDAHLRADLVFQGIEQALGAGHRAGQAVADPDGQRRRGGFAVMHDIEMRVEGGDLIDLGLGQPIPRQAQPDAAPRDARSDPG